MSSHADRLLNTGRRSTLSLPQIRLVAGRCVAYSIETLINHLIFLYNAQAVGGFDHQTGLPTLLLLLSAWLS